MSLLKFRDLKPLDKQIIQHLLEDSNQPLSSIAKKVNTTRQNISQRIKKLRKKNIIKSYTITLNNQLIEELQVRAYVFFREDPNIEIRKANEEKLKSIPQITHVSRLFGKYDVIIKLHGRDNEEITKIVNEIHTLKGISGTETFIVHTYVKDDENALLLHLLSL